MNWWKIAKDVVEVVLLISAIIFSIVGEYGRAIFNLLMCIYINMSDRP